MPLRFFPHCRHLTSGEAVMTFEAAPFTTTTTTNTSLRRTDIPHAYLRACRLHAALYTQPPIYLTWDLLTHQAQDTTENTSTTTYTSCTHEMCKNNMTQAFAPYMRGSSYARHSVAKDTLPTPKCLRYREATQTPSIEYARQLYDEAVTTLPDVQQHSYHTAPTCVIPTLSQRSIVHAECTTLAYFLPSVIYPASHVAFYDVDATLLFDVKYALYMRQQYEAVQVETLMNGEEGNRREGDAVQTALSDDIKYTPIQLRRCHAHTPNVQHSLREGLLVEWAAMQRHAGQVIRERHEALHRRTEQLQQACSEQLTQRPVGIITNVQIIKKGLPNNELTALTSSAHNPISPTLTITLHGQDVRVTLAELNEAARKAWRQWVEDTPLNGEVAADAVKYELPSPPLFAFQTSQTTTMSLASRCANNKRRYTKCDTSHDMKEAERLLTEALQSVTTALSRNTPLPIRRPSCALPEVTPLVTTQVTASTTPHVIVTQSPFCVETNAEAEADMQRRGWCCQTLGVAYTVEALDKAECTVDLENAMRYLQPHACEPLLSNVMKPLSHRCRARFRYQIEREAMAQTLLRSAMEQPLRPSLRVRIGGEGEEAVSAEEVEEQNTLVNAEYAVRLRNFAALTVSTVMRRHNSAMWNVWAAALSFSSTEGHSETPTSDNKLVSLRGVRVVHTNEEEVRVVKVKHLLREALHSLPKLRPTHKRAVTCVDVMRRQAALECSSHCHTSDILQSNSKEWLHEMLAVCALREYQLQRHSFFYDYVNAVCGNNSEEGSCYALQSATTTTTPAWLRPGANAEAVHASHEEDEEDANGIDEAELLRLTLCADICDMGDLLCVRDDQRQAVLVRSTRYMFTQQCRFVPSPERHTVTNTTPGNSVCIAVRGEEDIWNALRHLAADILRSVRHPLRRHRWCCFNTSYTGMRQAFFSLESQLATEVRALRSTFTAPHRRDSNKQEKEEESTQYALHDDVEDTMAAWLNGVEGVYCNTLITSNDEGQDSGEVMHVHFAYLHAMLSTQLQTFQAFYKSD